MDIKEFYAHALHIDSPWTVKSVAVDDGLETVDVYLECVQTAQFPCPCCGRPYPVGDYSHSKVWRHLDTCQKKTFLHARLPVVDCPEHGKQHLRIPWADKSPSFLGGVGGTRRDFIKASAMTSEFGKWIRRLVESFGDTKKAAHFAEVEHVIVRQLIEPVANPAENPVTSGSVPASSAAGPGSQTPKQISIFAQDMSFVNRGIQAFNKLELEKAVDLFQKHSSHYPKGYDISPWLKAAEFLLNGTSEAPHEPGKCLPYLCRLWDSFEDYLKSEQMDPDVFAAGAKSSYFARLFHEVERAGLAGSSILPENIPIGYVLLQAGQCEEAIRSLQECIPKMPQSAALYGWLGDAYLLRGELAVARRCYMEACFLGPAAIDWRHFRDAELKRLKEDILLYYGFELESALEWLPSHARIEGLFERKVVRVNDGLKEMVDDYLAMEKAWSKENSTRFAAKLFFRGMVLSENLENLKFIKKIDPIQVRRTMKQANPDLFEQFLEMVVGVKR